MERNESVISAERITELREWVMRCDWQDGGMNNRVDICAILDDYAALIAAPQTNIVRELTEATTAKHLMELRDQIKKAEKERDALRKAAEGIASDIPDLYGDHVEGGWLSVNLSADAVDELFAALASVAPGTAHKEGK